jgi:hypothetical protein
MKLSARLSLMGSCLGLIFLTAMPSSATVVGTLLTGGDGTVTVTPTGITFTENGSNDTLTPSSTAVGEGSTLTYSGSPALTQGDPIDINGGDTITPASLLLGVPVTFPNEPGLSITLTSFSPGTGTACTSGMALFTSCSPLGGASPIVLTDEPFGTTAVLSVSGTATDGTGTSEVSGFFSANIIGPDPFTLSTADSFTTTDSGTFSFKAEAVPEPRAISLIGFACLFMGIVVAKRRKSVA